MPAGSSWHDRTSIKMHPTHLPFWNVLLLFAKLKRIGLLKSISLCLILPFVVKCTLVFNQGLFHFLSSWTFKIQMHKYKCKCKLVFNKTFFSSSHTFKYTNTQIHLLLIKMKERIWRKVQACGLFRNVQQLAEHSANGNNLKLKHNRG